MVTGDRIEGVLPGAEDGAKDGDVQRSISETNTNAGDPNENSAGSAQEVRDRPGCDEDRDEDGGQNRGSNEDSDQWS